MRTINVWHFAFRPTGRNRAYSRLPILVSPAPLLLPQVRSLHICDRIARTQAYLFIKSMLDNPVSIGGRMEHSGLVPSIGVIGIILLSGLLAPIRAAWCAKCCRSPPGSTPLSPPLLHLILRPAALGASPDQGRDRRCLRRRGGARPRAVVLGSMISLGYYLARRVRGRSLSAVDRSLGLVLRSWPAA